MAVGGTDRGYDFYFDHRNALLQSDCQCCNHPLQGKNNHPGLMGVQIYEDLFKYWLLG